MLILCGLAALVLFFAPVPKALSEPPGKISESQSLPIIIDHQDRYTLFGHLYILKDQINSFTIDDVTTSEISRRFQISDREIPNFGVTSMTVWGRFSIRNPSNEPVDLILGFEHPVTDRISMFIPQKGGDFKKLSAGDSTEPSGGVIPGRYFFFPLTVPSQTQNTYYLKVESTGSLSMPLTLWRMEALHRNEAGKRMAYGILFGAVIILVIYFMVVGVRLRIPSCIWFSIYMICLGLLLAMYKGFLQEMLGPACCAYNNPLIVFIIGFLYFSGAKFLRTLLNTGSRSQWVDRVLWGLQWLGLVHAVMILFPSPFTPLVSLVVVGAGPLFSSTIAIIYWIKGVPNAKYFAFGWLMGHLTSTLDLLRIWGVIPYFPVMTYFLPATVVFSLVFFGLAMIEQTRHFQRLAMRDSLTGLVNRGRFEHLIEVEWNRHLRYQRPMTIIMIDLDHFKEYNDTYGHQRGDICLMNVAEVLKKYTRRPGEAAGRYGGEEFIMLLPELNGSEAANFADMIREDVMELGIRHSSSPIMNVVTASLGVASMVPSADGLPADLVRNADRALYLAKSEGRNRIKTFEI